MKILFNVDLNFTSNRRRFYVSMQEKTYCVQKYNSGKCVCFAIKIKC